MSPLASRNHRSFFTKLAKKYGLCAVFLFGSQARFEATPLSDLDLAYLPRKKLSNAQEKRIYVELLDYLKRDDVDFVDLLQTPISLAYSVIKEGQLLCCLDEKRLYDFIIETRREYLDTAYLRQIFVDAMKERIASGSFAK